jgi:hypothetical protein
MSKLGFLELKDCKMNRIRITSLRGTKQSRVKINEITKNSGLPRRSYLTARNDAKRETKAESLTLLAWGIAEFMRPRFKVRVEK